MIVGLLGSGRQDGNGAALLAAFAEGAAEAGAEFKGYNLSHLAFSGCTGCNGCRSTSEVCVLKDDLTPVLAETARSDGVVLVSPNYYGYLSGLAKSCIDRWYSFKDKSRKPRLRQGIPALFVMTQGHPDPAGYDWTLSSIGKVMAGNGFKHLTLVAPGVMAPGAVRDNGELMAEARSLGRRMATGDWG